MKILYLVRHGLAEDYSMATSDTARNLTKEGTREIEQMGKRLSGLHVQPNIIIASPYKRAHDTAEILSASLSYQGEILEDTRLTPMSRYETVGALLLEHKDEEKIMLVGHEPCMSTVASGICADGTMRIGFRQGSVCCIEVEHSRPIQGVMRWFVSPEGP